ncbi:hypothetical protein JW926_04730 [Candidatus Sumerlaeota bacterium]|nr:hypothetical protein [Candidatus Sumerlaeota bacterium]
MNKTYKHKISLLILAVLLLLPVAGFAIKKPTDEQKKDIQKLINKTKRYQAQYVFCRIMEAVSWAAMNPVAAENWRKAAEKYYEEANKAGDATVHKVDQDYDIAAPPGCTVDYDPNCDDYAYVPYTTDKKNIKVIICPPAMSDGPGLVASTKIHEMRHAWQVYQCYSSRPGFWRNCTWWGHWAEREAYGTEEYYYDICVTSDMPKEEKELIKKRYKEHCKAMDSLPKPKFTEDNKKAVPNSVVTMNYKVYNATGAPLTPTNISFKDEKGWSIVPPSVPGVTIPPEGEVAGSVDVTVPLDTAPWTANSLTIEAMCGLTSGSCTSVIYIHPFVRLAPLSELLASRGETVEVSFEIENESTSSETYNITMTNPLGWATTFTMSPLSMTSGEIKTLTAQVTVPMEIEPWITNLVFCEATAVSDPAQVNKKWVPIEVTEKDIGAFIVEAPAGELDKGEIFVPKVVVRNNGHIDSFFDVFFEIPEVPGSGETVNAGSLAPGQVTTVSFTPQSISTAGTYETRGTIILSGDADAFNDVTTGTVTILPGSKVGDWKEIIK